MDILALSTAQYFLSLVGPWWERLLVLESLVCVFIVFYPFKDHERFTSWGQNSLIVTSLTLGLAFLYLPMIILVIYSFNGGKLVTVWAGFSTKWYVSLLHNDQILGAVQGIF